MASLTQWTWVWVNSRSWWWTGRPGVLQFMGLQRVRHNWTTELNKANWKRWVEVGECGVKVVLYSSQFEILFNWWFSLDFKNFIPSILVIYLLFLIPPLVYLWSPHTCIISDFKGLEVRDSNTFFVVLYTISISTYHWTHIIITWCHSS